MKKISLMWERRFLVAEERSRKKGADKMRLVFAYDVKWDLVYITCQTGMTFDVGSGQSFCWACESILWTIRWAAYMEYQYVI